EFCEEASVFTLHLWKQRKRTPLADELDRSLKDIQEWETANLRTWEDTTAEETARVLREKFGYVQTWVVRGVTIETMKEELRKGRPLIVPAAGRELSSPYYKPPGPLYHMLVVIGYDEATREFITNDVGTNTKGAGFRFTYDDLYGAMGDWDIASGAPDTSKKVMIVVE
ncbi:MAG: C39 family peptidase, partial [bacterium]|nr:C39 family peptidase [bacterium]